MIKLINQSIKVLRIVLSTFCERSFRKPADYKWAFVLINDILVKWMICNVKGLMQCNNILILKELRLNMQIVSREDVEIITIVMNEFIVANEVNSKESIPIEFLKYLRKVNLKIQDGGLFNELCDSIEKKLIKND